MHILFVTPLYSPWVGGIEHLVRQVVAELRSRGHETAIVTGAAPRPAPVVDMIDDVPVMRLDVHGVLERQNPAEILRMQSDVARFADEFAPDVVHSHDLGPVQWACQRALHRLPLPFVVTVHTVLSRRFDRMPSALVAQLGGARRITGVSPAVVDDLRALLPDAGAPVALVRNGIRPPTAAATPVPDGPPRLLCAGRLMPEKAFDVAIDAMARLATMDRALRLTIAGDGPEASPLRRRAVERGVAHQVHFLGMVEPERMSLLLRASQAVLMPSRVEGMPLIALEAAWAGRPVVAARTPGLTSTIVEGETGVLVEPHPDAMADAVASLLADRRALQTLGERARAYAEREYGLATCVDSYEAVYRSAIGDQADANG